MVLPLLVLVVCHVDRLVWIVFEPILSLLQLECVDGVDGGNVALVDDVLVGAEVTDLPPVLVVHMLQLLI